MGFQAHESFCRIRCLRFLIDMRAFYKQPLWIFEFFGDLHHRVLVLAQKWRHFPDLKNRHSGRARRNWSGLGSQFPLQ